jgi:multidrug efflux system outer membrane protein
MPGNWQQEEEANDKKAAVQQMKWWTVFKDSKLNELQELALEASPSLKEAALKVLQARVLAQGAESSFYPELTAQFGADYQRGLLEKLGVDGAPAGARGRVKSFSLPLNLNYEIDLWRKTKNSALAASARARAEELSYRAFLLRLTTDVATLYFQILSTQKEKHIVEEYQRQRQASWHLQQAQFAAGLISESDFSQSELDLAAGTQDLLGLESSLESSTYALKILVGQPELSLSLAAEGKMPKLPHIPAGLPSRLLERRPDIRQSQELIEACFCELKVARADYLPTISLSASLSYISPELSQLFKKDNRISSLGGALAQSLFDGGARSSQFRSLKLQLEQQALSYRQTVLAALQEVEDALTRIRYQKRQLASHQMAARAADRIFDLSQKRFQQGISSYAEVIAAKESALTEERSKLAVTTEGLLATISLIQALGGGWE